MDCMEDAGIQKMFMDLAHMIFQKDFGVLMEKGVYPGQMPLLKLLSKENGLSQKQVAQRLHISPPSVTVSAKRMEKNGLVERKPDEKDQRIQRIYITKKGEAVNELIMEIFQDNEKQLLKGFEEGEIYLLRRFFQHMIRNIQEDMPKEKGDKTKLW